MKVVILGANGKTGKELVKLALQQNHDVTAVTRTPEAFSEVPKLKALKANIYDSEELQKVFRGHDAVLSTLGNNKSKPIERSSQAIIDAMDKAGVKRLVVELAFGGAESATLSKPVRKINDWVLGKMLEDQKAGMKIIEQSDLKWTIFYATILTNGLLTKKTKIVPSTEKITSKYKIARADVSYAMLESAQNDTFLREMPVISGA